MSLISVIVPVYKVEAYLRECVDSIINQTYKNLEIILVDDGSPDNCPAICDEYALKDERIIVIHQKNGGLSAARNAGLEVATGEYICFVDSDDLIHPRYCEILLAGIIENNTLMCACKVKSFTDNDIYDMESDSETSIVSYCSQSDFLLKQMTRDLEMGVWNRIYKRSVFDNIRFLKGKLHEDIIFAGDLFDLTFDHVTLVDKTLYYYRQRIDGIIGSQTTKCKCNPDRVFAGEYIFTKARAHNFIYLDNCLTYALLYPWFFVDKIFLTRSFKENKQFLDELRKFIKSVKTESVFNNSFSKIIRHRMIILSHSKILYAFNVYARLLRVYMFRLFKLDAYKNGHGI